MSTTQTTLVATLTTPPSDDGEEIRQLPEGVGFLEVRADLVGELDPDWLRDRFDGALIYTLRSAAEGGSFKGGRRRRQGRFREAAERYDLVDLEADRDLGDDLLGDLPADKRLISWHGPAASLAALTGRFENMAETDARFYKLIPEARQTVDAIRPLALLCSLRRDDVIAFASRDAGAWTRLLAPRLGSPLVYGSLGEVPAAPGQLTVEKLAVDYGLPRLDEVKGLFGIVGKPVLHSLSPRLHNGAYRALGVPGLYVPFHVESFGDFWLDLVESGSLGGLGIPLWGLSVTSPYKEVALSVAGISSPRAQHIGAANTLVLHEMWEAESTDPEGVVLALEHAGVKVAGARSVVVGCGGAGKAAAVGLQMAGAEVTLVNRGAERGRKASMELRLPFQPLADFDPGAYEIVVQATALGHQDDDALPFDPARLRPDAALVDMVYGPEHTRLLKETRARDIIAVDGREVLLHQALGQFRLMTSCELEEPLARDLLGLEGARTQRIAVAPEARETKHGDKT
ncbi:MAG: type I 3-dehydroquinate dehydratase [bacterium]|nr:type I 3-dehydroquinate dehydratase [bacterium]